VSIDALTVIGTPVAQASGVYDDADPAFGYEGRWFTLEGIAEASAGTLRYSVTPDYDTQVTFAGRQVKLTYLATPSSGNADIYVDGAKVATLNQYSENWDWQNVWTSDLFADGVHSLRVVHASGGFVNIDALTVLASPVLLTDGMYDDFDPAFSYQGRWKMMEAVTGPYSDTLHYSMGLGEATQVSFSGQQVTLTYLAAPTAGVVDVYIDGVKVMTIEQYSDSWNWQQTWTSDVLAAGDHSLRVVFASGSSGSFGNVDAVTVIP
jgi:hypothetical protein